MRGRAILSIAKIVETMQREVLSARAEEQATLQDIAKIATVEFAEEAAGVLDSRKELCENL